VAAPLLTVGPVARDREGVIGKDGILPWRLSADLNRFKALTLGKPVIMGRKTWESLPIKPLPGRMNIVLTRDGSYAARGALTCETFSEAVQIAREQAAEDGAEEFCIIGGYALFELALPKARRMYLTEVEPARRRAGVLPPVKVGGGDAGARRAGPDPAGLFIGQRLAGGAAGVRRATRAFSAAVRKSAL
jgi:dihydrofolate reductase